MPITQHTIAGFPPPPEGFAHVTSASGSRIVHISGQVGADETGAIVPGGLAAQSGAAARAHRAFPEVAVTLLGVSSLFTPDMLIEAEAVAVFDG
jgi:hypothetical protein